MTLKTLDFKTLRQKKHVKIHRRRFKNRIRDQRI